MKVFEQCSGCGSKMTDAELDIAKAAAPGLISCCPDRNMLKLTDNGHSLFRVKDFTTEEAARLNVLYVVVVKKGLNVCKICGKFESGLNRQCKGRP